ncbi:hypothetical protein B9Z37_08510, partial [Limnohabitans parvus II-B4]
STLDGGGNALTITGVADIDGTVSGVTNLSVTGASNIGADITTSGTQTYAGAVTLSGGGRTLTASTVHTQSTLVGGGNALTIAGAADIDGTVTGVTNLSVTGTSNIGADITTSGTQTYSGSVTLSGGNRNLTASTVNTQGTLVGGGNALTILAAADIDGAVTGLTNLSVTGTSSIGADVTTSGTQTYAGAVTLSGGSRILAASVVNTQSTLDGGGNALTITGVADIDGTVSGVTNLSVTGASNIGADITTSGTQTYAGAVTLSGGDRTLTASTVHTQSTLVGGGNALTIAGAADIDAAYTGLTTLSISGASNIGADIDTSGTQTYAGDVTLSGDMRTDSGSTGVLVTTEFGGTAMVYPVRMSSSAGDLNFLGKVDGGVFAKTNMRSLQLNAAGQITFKDKVGFDAALDRSSSLLDNYTRHFGIYRLDVTAPIINLLGDIAAYEEIAFNGSTYVGGTAYNGTYRRVYSMDPKITFNGPVDGYGGTDGVYTLDARAISLDIRLPEPEIFFAADVGSRRQLAGLVATVARLDGILPDRFSDLTGEPRDQEVRFGMPTTPNVGTIRFAGNVATSGLQSYLANRFVIDTSSGSTALEFNSTSGDVGFSVGQGGLVSASGGAPRIKFANRPSSATISALRSSGAVIASESNELSEWVKLREISKASEAKLMELDLDQRAGQAPTVEVGDLISVNCTSVEEERCAPEANVQKSVKDAAVIR